MAVHDESEGGPGRTWWIAYAVCAAAAAIPLLITYRLPMADLPQHAVQLTVWKFLDRPCYGFRALYDVNWRTPYLLGMLVLHAVAAFVRVQTALKIVVYATIVAVPLVLERITRLFRLDPWIALLAFPLGFGFTFYWGIVNFNIVMPLVALLLWDCSRDEISTVKSLLVAALIAVAHGMAYGLALIVTVPMLLVRRMWRPAIAILVPLPFLLLWVARTAAQQARARAPWEWELHPRRILQMLDFQLSAGGDVDAFWAAVVLVLVVVMAGVGIARERWRWAPFVAAAIAFLLMPSSAFGQKLLYHRIASVLPAAALVALAPGRPRVSPRLAKGLILSVVLIWMAVLGTRFRLFDEDADGFDRLVDGLPSNQRLLLLEGVQSAEITGMPFLHWSGYYAVRKGGVIGWSFASNFVNVVRYRTGFNPGVAPVITYNPLLFDWTRDSHFDYFIVRAPDDPTGVVFRGAANGVRLLRRNGMWWLFENRRRVQMPACPPLEPDRRHTPVLDTRW